MGEKHEREGGPPKGAEIRRSDVSASYVGARRRKINARRWLRAEGLEHCGTPGPGLIPRRPNALRTEPESACDSHGRCPLLPSAFVVDDAVAGMVDLELLDAGFGPEALEQLSLVFVYENGGRDKDALGAAA